MKKIIYVFLFGILLVIGGCGKNIDLSIPSLEPNPSDYTFSFRGKVINQSDSSGIGDAIVTAFTLNMEALKATRTNSRGEFQMYYQGRYEVFLDNDSISVRASKYGYSSNSVKVQFSRGWYCNVIIPIKKIAQ